MTDILLGIADFLLAAIVFRGFWPTGKTATVFMQEPARVEPLKVAIEPAPPVEGDGVVDTETEYVMQERYIDDWVAEHCKETHDPAEKQHQRWEGLKHYNRTKR
jgi:hypothetical protein